MKQQTAKIPEGSADTSSSSVSNAHPDQSASIEELSRRLLSWGSLWSGEPGSQRHLARERLSTWLERCIGHDVRSLMGSRAGDLSLATSTPLLAAFLGRRATRELSRQVLRDL